MEKISANVISKMIKVNIDGKEMSIRNARKLQNRLLNQVNSKSITRDEYINGVNKSEEIDKEIRKRATNFGNSLNDAISYDSAHNLAIRKELDRTAGGDQPQMFHKASQEPKFRKYRDIADSPVNDDLTRGEFAEKFPLYNVRMAIHDPKDIAQYKILMRRDLGSLHNEKMDHLNRVAKPNRLQQEITKRQDPKYVEREIRNKEYDEFERPSVLRAERFKLQEANFNPSLPPKKKAYSAPGIDNTIVGGLDTTPIKKKKVDIPALEDSLKSNREELAKIREDLKTLPGRSEPDDAKQMAAEIAHRQMSSKRREIHKTLEKIQDEKNSAKYDTSVQRHKDLKHLPEDVQRAIATMRRSFTKTSSLGLTKTALDIDQINKVLGIAKQRGDLIDLKDGDLTRKRINVLKNTLDQRLKNKNIGGSLRKKLTNDYGKGLEELKDATGSLSTGSTGRQILADLANNGEFIAGVNKKTGEPQLKSRKLADVTKTMRLALLQKRDSYAPPTSNQNAQDLYRGLVGMHELSELKGARNILKKTPGHIYSATDGTRSSHQDRQVLEDLNRARALKGSGASDAASSIRHMRDAEINRMIQTAGDESAHGNMFKQVNPKKPNNLQKLISAQGHGDLIEDEVSDLAFENAKHNQKILSKVPERLYNHPMVQSRLKPMDYDQILQHLRDTKYKLNRKGRDHVYRILDSRAEAASGAVGNTHSNKSNTEQVKYWEDAFYPKKYPKDIPKPDPAILNSPKIGSQTRKMK